MAEAAPKLTATSLSVVEVKKLTPKQREAAILYSQSKSYKDICKALHVTNRTLCKWFNLPEFKAELHRLVDKVEESSETKLRILRDLALDSLKEAMLARPGSVASVRAASILLSNQPKKVPKADSKLSIKFGGLRRAPVKEVSDA